MLILGSLLCALSADAAPKSGDKAEKPTTELTAKIEALKSSPFKKELQALDKATLILTDVTDEKSAKAAYQKIQLLFRSLPPLLGGSAQELELLAQAQNMVSEQMWKRMNEPYFKTGKLQEIWTLLTDQFSRRSAEPR